MRRLVLYLAPALLALAACGEAPRPATDPRVTLTLDAPDDGRQIRAASITVSGTVTPADASVAVAGEDATVDGGRFSAPVRLAPGGNVIDVSATARGRRPAVDAVRVVRDMRVEIPQLVGSDRDAAVAALRRLGLEQHVQRGGSWLDRIIPGGLRVCATQPGGGGLVAPGSAVTLVVARTCG